MSELHKALLKVQGEIRSADLNATNPHLKNKYADLASILDSTGLRELCTQNGLLILQVPYTEEVEETGAVWIGVETHIIHVDTDEEIKIPLDIPLGQPGKGRSTAQEAGAIITYLRRYTLAPAFGIVAEEDTDGHRPAAKRADTRPATTNGKKPPSPAAQKYWAELGPLERKVYKDLGALIPAIIEASKRYEAEIAARGAVTKIFPKYIKDNSWPGKQTQKDGRIRVNIFRSVVAYAQMRNAGMDGDQAKSQAISTGRNLAHL